MNFDEWWNEGYDDTENPFAKYTFGYWAYAGWCGHAEQETQEPKREWVGLTDDEIIAWWESENGLAECDMTKLFDFATVVRSITKKLKEKNT